MNIIGMQTVHVGDCRDLFEQLPDESVDIVITSPPYWGQRETMAVGVEEDPRQYLETLVDIFKKTFRVLKPSGLLWVNIGDAYDTPINWRHSDHEYSRLGSNGNGLSPYNSAYKKNRAHRKAYVENGSGWLKYGNLLALPYRLVIRLCDIGFYFRGEIIWRKLNPLPEGRCRRPHRVHEGIYLLSKREDHAFTISPPIKSVWEFSNEGRKESHAHYGRFPEELPRRCIMASGVPLEINTVILDPFAGSGTTGVAASRLGCSFVGFEIDEKHVQSANKRILSTNSVSSLFEHSH